MKKDLFDKLKEGKINELSPEEKNDLDTLASTEQEIFVIQQILQNAQKIKEEQFSNTQINPSIKFQLDSLFEQNHSKRIWHNSALIFLWNKDKKWINQHSLKIAAIICVLFSFIPFITWKTDEHIQIAKQENIVKDTNTIQNEKKLTREEGIEKKLENKNLIHISDQKTEEKEKRDVGGCAWMYGRAAEGKITGRRKTR